jgi:hypothetical protein
VIVNLHNVILVTPARIGHGDCVFVVAGEAVHNASR